jgi:hypothetical protein
VGIGGGQALMTVHCCACSGPAALGYCLFQATAWPGSFTSIHQVLFVSFIFVLASMQAWSDKLTVTLQLAGGG